MELEKIIQKIEEHKNEIAKERDKLRDVVDYLKNILESFDLGIENLEYGIVDTRDTNKEKAIEVWPPRGCSNLWFDDSV